MKNMILIAVLVFMTGVIIGVILVTETSSLIGLTRSLKTTCEQSLPRNQICIMQYIAEPQKEVSDG